ncbi:MAG: hypothetical protein JW806_08370 [Sedimentisphaerales bacterium]|nr:hypothetical protein [Sedimentisphaerales bacterium]
MKPSKLQILFAKRWPWGIAFWICPLLIGTGFATYLYTSKGGLISAVLTGAVVGVSISYFSLHSFYLLRAKINGAPFYKDDTVYILIGEYQGQVAKVYEVWNDRKDVCVDLGEQAKNELKDIFSFNEICRVNK